jgi:hypothetical protein
MDIQIRNINTDEIFTYTLFIAEWFSATFRPDAVGSHFFNPRFYPEPSVIIPLNSVPSVVITVEPQNYVHRIVELINPDAISVYFGTPDASVIARLPQTLNARIRVTAGETARSVFYTTLDIPVVWSVSGQSFTALPNASLLPPGFEVYENLASAIAVVNVSDISIVNVGNLSFDPAEAEFPVGVTAGLIYAALPRYIRVPADNLRWYGLTGYAFIPVSWSSPSALGVGSHGMNPNLGGRIFRTNDFSGDGYDFSFSGNPPGFTVVILPYSLDDIIIIEFREFPHRTTVSEMLEYLPDTIHGWAVTWTRCSETSGYVFIGAFDYIPDTYTAGEIILRFYITVLSPVFEIYAVYPDWNDDVIYLQYGTANLPLPLFVPEIGRAHV